MTASSSAFRALHHRAGLFVMPNPWDVGTAKLLAGLGFTALATSSAALAWSQGKADATGQVTRADAVAHARAIVQATALPVNGDFESGYGETPADVAETIRQAIDCGLAGCSIEDRDQSKPDGGLYPADEALRRFEAAKNAAEKAGSGFVLTGRCEVFFSKHPDPLTEAVTRLKAYAAAGADVVYAPGVKAEEQVRQIVQAVAVPVNVLGGLGGVSSDLATLERLGVKRVSIGGSLARSAFGAFLRAAKGLTERRFDYGEATSAASLNGAFARP
jgi:2-methylisocitrate lyase-like PEP mutase family enzyme